MLRIDVIKQNSSASYAGLYVNDVIIQIGGHKFNSHYQQYYKELKIELNKIKNNETKIVVLREGKLVELKIIPKLSLNNQYELGVFFKRKCIRNRDSKDKLTNYSEDITYHECDHALNIKKDLYLKNLSNASKDYEYLYDEKIKIKYYLASDYLEIKSVFDFKKAEKFLIEAFNLSKNKSLENKSNYAHQDIFKPSFFAYKLGTIFSNKYNNYRSDLTNENFIDYPKAVKWFSIAAEENNTDAMYELGLLYLKGYSKVTKNHKKAFDLLNNSTRLGRDEGNYDLANFYLFGLGGKEKSYYKAMLHFKLSNITRFNKSADYYNVFLLHKYKELPDNDRIYYSWLTKELINYKTISAIEKAADFAFYYLGDHSESYKWYEICSKANKSKEWNKNLTKGWLRNVKKRCLKKTRILSQYFLKEEKITEGKLFAQNWINKNID